MQTLGITDEPGRRIAIQSNSGHNPVYIANLANSTSGRIGTSELWALVGQLWVQIIKRQSSRTILPRWNARFCPINGEVISCVSARWTRVAKFFMWPAKPGVKIGQIGKKYAACQTLWNLSTTIFWALILFFPYVADWLDPFPVGQTP